MPIATWPAGMRQYPDKNGFSVRPQSNRATFQPEIGPPIARRRGTAAGTIMQMTFSHLTEGERDAFITFYEDATMSGTLPFEWNDPVSQTMRRFTFSDDQAPYDLSAMASGRWRLSLQLLRLP